MVNGMRVDEMSGSLVNHTATPSHFPNLIYINYSDSSFQAHFDA